MNGIINFVKEMFMINTNEKSLIGLCGFESEKKPAAKKIKPVRNREMRLSELMDK